MVRDTSARMGNPSVAVTLTSVDPDRDTSATWSRDTEQVVRALRRRWPRAEYLAFMEWTTGRGPRSGGRRRPHAHLLVRGLPRQDAARADAIVRTRWSARTGANRVEVAPLRSAEDGVAYLALHHLKDGQAPPENWRGRRLRASKGWWGTDAHALRQRSREAVLERAHRHHARAERTAYADQLVAQGCPPDIALDLALGPAEDPRPLPAREPAEVVTLRRHDLTRDRGDVLRSIVTGAEVR